MASGRVPKTTLIFTNRKGAKISRRFQNDTPLCRKIAPMVKLFLGAGSNLVNLCPVSSAPGRGRLGGPFPPRFSGALNRYSDMFEGIRPLDAGGGAAAWHPYRGARPIRPANTHMYLWQFYAEPSGRF